MADTLSIVSTICFLAAGISFAAAAALFFAFKIPGVYGELSGRSARKSLEKLRSENESSAAKFYKNSEMFPTAEISGTEELAGDFWDTGLLGEEPSFQIIEEVILVHTDRTI